MHAENMMIVDSNISNPTTTKTTTTFLQYWQSATCLVAAQSTVDHNTVALTSWHFNRTVSSPWSQTRPPSLQAVSNLFVSPLLWSWLSALGDAARRLVRGEDVRLGAL